MTAAKLRWYTRPICVLQSSIASISTTAQVLGVVARMMRRILRTHGDDYSALKRGGEITIVYLADVPEPAATSVVFFSEVDCVHLGQAIVDLGAAVGVFSKVNECSAEA